MNSATPERMRAIWFAWLVLALLGSTASAVDHRTADTNQSHPKALPQVDKLRLAICDLAEDFAEDYPDAETYLKRLNSIELRLRSGDLQAPAELERLRAEALLANPLLDVPILLVKRRAKHPVRDIGIPAPHETNSHLKRAGWDNELAVLNLRGKPARLQTVYRPTDGGYVGEVDLHFDGQRILFTQSDAESWKLWEMNLNGTGLRQVSLAPPDVDCFDGCYLPSGQIVFASTASYQSVPCWHGQMPVGNLYLMDSDGRNMRQLCFDQDIDSHPVVLGNGQVMFNRWDYTGINHIFLRQLMVMNPDGTGQRAVYGSNSWFPNSLFFMRPLPGASSRLVSILSGYHGVPRMGWLVTLDTSRGWRETQGIVRRISGQGSPVKPVVKDEAVNADWPKFLHPFPLSDRHFLVSCWKDDQSGWALYLADVFDNLVPLYADREYALLEPVAIRPRPTPPVLPNRVDTDRDDATVYLHDVYAGPGLAGVPRGTVKRLRVISYHFGYRGLAGSDKIGYGGPWDGMQIEGTVPVEPDGSALFRVPACTPLAVQPLDADGRAVQLMRSWFTAMPSEQLSCIGCHETPAESGYVGRSAAALAPPRAIEPWFGPPRGFDFAREVQPVLNRHCVGCHDGNKAKPDLRPEEMVESRQTWPIGYPKRLDPDMVRQTGGRMTYTPAYDALIHSIRRVGIEDTVDLLEPGAYHADTSPLVQMLEKGHQGVRLQPEDWDRLVAWIDLNAPCHGTWGEVFPIPNHAHRRRMELRAQYGGPTRDPEAVPGLTPQEVRPIEPITLDRPEPIAIGGWPLTREQASERQQAGGPVDALLDLGGGLTMRLIRVPAGRFVMGSVTGEPDEYPQAAVSMDEPFWMGACEVSNAQFHRFDPGHDSGRYVKRLPRPDCEGLSLDEPDQPAVRVSWHQAMAFCRWLSEQTGAEFSLPTEAQWEYACRAGSATAMSYGGCDADFSPWSNLADATFARGALKPLDVHPPTVSQWSGGVPHLVLEGARLADDRYRDHASVTATSGSYRPNAWGLFDMHGNAAEWTRSLHRPYPYRHDDGRNGVQAAGARVVRGGSYFDPPRRARSAHRLHYPPWHRLFNVGFRVVCEEATLFPTGRIPSNLVGRTADRP